MKAKNESLEKMIKEMDRKADDLEGRAKRNNLIIHGLVRTEKETGEGCEGVLKDLITDRLELADDIQFDRVHRLNAMPNSPVVARCTFFKDKVKILKAQRKLQGTNVFIGEDFSSHVRDVRRRLVPHLKKARSENKKCMMVFDHLIIDGKKFALDDGDNPKEMRQDSGRSDCGGLTSPSSCVDFVCGDVGGKKRTGTPAVCFARVIRSKEYEARTGVSGVSDDNASVCDAEAYVWTVMKSQKLVGLYWLKVSSVCKCK